MPIRNFPVDINRNLVIDNNMRFIAIGWDGEEKNSRKTVLQGIRNSVKPPGG